MKTITAEVGQTVHDICVQEYGTLSALFKLHQDNVFPEFPAVLQPGQVILVDDEYQSPAPLVVKLLQLNKPASGYAVYKRQGGIGYMQIGTDFIVS